jgi:hypothetical protein
MSFDLILFRFFLFNIGIRGGMVDSICSRHCHSRINTSNISGFVRFVGWYDYVFVSFVFRHILCSDIIIFIPVCEII